MPFPRLSVIAFAAAFFAAHPAPAQVAKLRIDKAADLPRFEYRIDGKVEDLLADPAKFGFGYEIVLSVHDELITEAPDTDGYNAPALCAIERV